MDRNSILSRIRKLEAAQRPISDLIETATLYYKDGTKKTLFYYEAIELLTDEEIARIDHIEPKDGLVWALLTNTENLLKGDN